MRATGRTITYGQLDVLTRAARRRASGPRVRTGSGGGDLCPQHARSTRSSTSGSHAPAVPAPRSTGCTPSDELAEQLRNSGARFLFTIGAMLDRALPAAAAAGVEAVFTLDGAERTWRSRVRADAGKCRRPGHAPARPGDRARGAALLERHHRLRQGRHAHPPKHGRQRRPDRSATSRSARTTCWRACCRSFTSTGRPPS